MKIPNNELICPDCYKSLNITNNLFCKYCNRRFIPIGEIYPLLPSNLEESKLAENDAHVDMEWIKKPWKIPAFKYLDCLHHEEDIIPLLKSKERILEIGSSCGWASLNTKLCYPDSKIYVSDISLNSLFVSLSLFKYFKMDMETSAFPQADMENLPFCDNLFNAVYLWSTIHHAVDPIKALKEINRVVKKDAVLIVHGESAFSKPLKYIVENIYFRSEKKRAKQLGINEKKFTFKEWKEIFQKSNFHDFEMIHDRDLKFVKTFKQKLSYKIINHIPDNFIDKIGCAIHFIARKH